MELLLNFLFPQSFFIRPGNLPGNDRAANAATGRNMAWQLPPEYLELVHTLGDRFDYIQKQAEELQMQQQHMVCAATQFPMLPVYQPSVLLTVRRRMARFGDLRRHTADLVDQYLGEIVNIQYVL